MAQPPLDAAHRQHHSPCRIAQVGAEGKRPEHSKSGGYFARGDDPRSFTNSTPYEGLVSKVQRLVERKPYIIHELRWRRPGAPLSAIDDEEVRDDSGRYHGLAQPEKGDRRAKA